MNEESSLMHHRKSHRSVWIRSSCLIVGFCLLAGTALAQSPFINTTKPYKWSTGIQYRKNTFDAAFKQSGTIGEEMPGVDAVLDADGNITTPAIDAIPALRYSQDPNIESEDGSISSFLRLEAPTQWGPKVAVQLNFTDEKGSLSSTQNLSNETRAGRSILDTYRNSLSANQTTALNGLSAEDLATVESAIEDNFTGVPRWLTHEVNPRWSADLTAFIIFEDFINTPLDAYVGAGASNLHIVEKITLGDPTDEDAEPLDSLDEKDNLLGIKLVGGIQFSLGSRGSHSAGSYPNAEGLLINKFKFHIEYYYVQYKGKTYELDGGEVEILSETTTAAGGVFGPVDVPTSFKSGVSKLKQTGISFGFSYQF